MKYSIVIIFITIQLFNVIQSNDGPLKAHPCDLVRCLSQETCPPGSHLKKANREKFECCSFCVSDTTENNRRKRELNCEGIQCSPPKCEDGYKLTYNREKACCPYCEKPNRESNIGRFG